MADETPTHERADPLAAYREPIERVLGEIIRAGKFQLKFRIVQPQSWGEGIETPELLVELSGPDADLLLDAHAELLTALEYVVLRAARVGEHLIPRVVFDSKDYRRTRLDELRLMAQVAADRVKEMGVPFTMSAMNSRERRVVHLALRDRAEVRTESAGDGHDRHVVIYPAAPARGR